VLNFEGRYGSTVEFSTAKKCWEKKLVFGMVIFGDGVMEHEPAP